MPMDAAIASLRNNTIRMCSPSTWKDPFEKHFYEMAQRLGKMTDKPFDTALSALCVTTNPHCEAAWEMYSRKPEDKECTELNLCVRFKIYTGQFREYLSKFAREMNYKIFEGKVDYSISERQLRSIGNPQNKLTSGFCEDFDLNKYLNLMLLKRQQFSYENEVRFLCSGPSLGKEEIFIPIPWSQCLYSVQLHSDASDKSRELLRNALEENYRKCLQDYPTRRLTLINVPIIENTLYSPVPPIVMS